MTAQRRRPRRSYANGVQSACDWLTVVETPSFLARANGRLTADEVKALITTLARDPTRGDLIKGTGGVRKMRVATGGHGKSGGARVIYYFYNQTVPLFLLTVFAKNERSDLTQAERNNLAAVVESIRECYGRRA